MASALPAQLSTGLQLEPGVVSSRYTRIRDGASQHAKENSVVLYEA